MAAKFSTRSLLWNRWFAAAVAIVTTFLTIGGMVFFLYIHPFRAAGIQQPVPFSHWVHATTKQIDCRFCHSSVERTPFASIPSAQKCLYCHKYIIPTHPQILKVAAAAERNEPIQWRKVNWLPDHVWFSHQRHIRKDVECVSCHGRAEDMQRIQPVHEFTMGFCIDCHREKKASQDCWTCHK